MTDIDRIKAEVQRMMDEEMSIFKKSCQDGDEPSAGPCMAYMRLQMLMKFIDGMPREVDFLKVREKASALRSHIPIEMFAGRYANLADIESLAPKRLGLYAATDLATYSYDGKQWTVVATEQYITFKVVCRRCLTGRRYITVILNPDHLPISQERSAVCSGQYRLPILSIDTVATLNDGNPMINWGLVTSEKTSGDYLTVRMFPDEEEKSSDTKE